MTNNWIERAACKGMTHLFFLPLQNGHKDANAEKTKLAKYANRAPSNYLAEISPETTSNTAFGEQKTKTSGTWLATTSLPQLECAPFDQNWSDRAIPTINHYPQCIICKRPPAKAEGPLRGVLMQELFDPHE